MPRRVERKLPLRYILFHKPYGVVSQFSPLTNHKTLSDFGPFPKGVYPVGRLDADSEGLLLLTNDNAVKQKLVDPRFGHPREYLAQVEEIPAESDLETLRNGILLDKRRTLPAEVEFVNSEPSLPARTPPIRFRINIPTAWIRLRLHEGKNRQIRRMTASIGHPTLRLVRTKIDFLKLTDLGPGEHRDLTSAEVARLKMVVGPSRASRRA